MPFLDLFQRVDEVAKADVMMFTGGEDVDPYLYNEPLGKYTYSNIARDRQEAIMFGIAEDHGIKKIGICRGSQFLTVQSGGKMVQDVTNHAGTHEVFTKDDRTFLMSSTHHQMMNPFVLPENEYDILAWADGRSDHYLNGWNKEVEGFKKRGIEPEIVWYPKTQALCIQPHPEIMRKDAPGVDYCRQLVKEYLL